MFPFHDNIMIRRRLPEKLKAYGAGSLQDGFGGTCADWQLSEGKFGFWFLSVDPEYHSMLLLIDCDRQSVYCVAYCQPYWAMRNLEKSCLKDFSSIYFSISICICFTTWLHVCSRVCHISSENPWCIISVTISVISWGTDYFTCETMSLCYYW